MRFLITVRTTKLLVDTYKIIMKNAGDVILESMLKHSFVHNADFQKV